MPDEQRHLQSRRWLEGWFQTDGPIVAPTIVVGEVAGALSRRTGKPSVGRDAADHLFALTMLHLVDIDTHLSRSVVTLAADLGLRGADATYVAVAQRYDLPLLTWDREQAERASAVVAVQTPEA